MDRFMKGGNKTEKRESYFNFKNASSNTSFGL